MIVEFLALCHAGLHIDAKAFEEIQLFIGHEPNTIQSSQQRLFQHELSEEVKKYWLQERGISIFLCAKVIVAIELIKSGKVKAKLANTKRPFHAKIFRGDNAITSGSSNFSQSGLIYQLEKNNRYEKNKERKRYEESCQIAESYWRLGRDYNNELIVLLEDLLNVVTWQEALARACAELLEGEWAKRYIPTNYSLIKIFMSLSLFTLKSDLNILSLIFNLFNVICLTYFYPLCFSKFAPKIYLQNYCYS
ncbi:hypothetical protein Chro_3880 [Chroococcidiopsis thermalis PCC 7203]|jgi:hypothetical protein|uniref:Phospholipase D-like domain-containing protein n=2 Tax=Chroococcidiopsis thermalis TaxID=54299 RepID=K9U4H1_CHRTP|nr:hypothetical protein Chro_3880 [Chroococcidiopsis thermalis PCC 7203]PSB44780.1 hypothetical protein C7B80_19315 [Cyanosarcina cf. burmensis CCALA 770]